MAAFDAGLMAFDGYLAVRSYLRGYADNALTFSMYLRISDIAGRANWKPCMGDFRSDPEGNWWFHVVGKGNKAAKVAVRDDYITDYLTRYRRFLGLSPMPEYQEKTPLITTLSG